MLPTESFSLYGSLIFGFSAVEIKKVGYWSWRKLKKKRQRKKQISIQASENQSDNWFSASIKATTHAPVANTQCKTMGLQDEICRRTVGIFISSRTAALEIRLTELSIKTLNFNDDIGLHDVSHTDEI